MTTPAVSPTLPELLRQSAALHRHLCPRQVLGARAGLLAGEWLGLDFPRADKRVLTFVETDGCFADGVSVASGCWLGRRTLRLVDHGKVAATFVDTKTGRAVRIAPRTDLRARVREARPDGQKRWDAYLAAYQTWPDEALFAVQPVRVTLDLAALISVAGLRTTCDRCGEEIVNGREVSGPEGTLCRDCAGERYWEPG
ncbi:FmdE family protein [Deinococcus budaensis]|uniref:Formylmethanofuran dehydrogenase subunit E n=1 Tax=Deinococcus budaensis TaxID=1665626 RepID=A0A7W8GG56_9DEIO|nr:FmdE family protein [Deinococcus budaensis]MBB5235074.1 formylmethanofuran dehydrogenase subunit E [Deinococcus budaensis]